MFLCWTSPLSINWSTRHIKIEHVSSVQKVKPFMVSNKKTCVSGCAHVRKCYLQKRRSTHVCFIYERVREWINGRPKYVLRRVEVRTHVFWCVKVHTCIFGSTQVRSCVFWVCFDVHIRKHTTSIYFCASKNICSYSCASNNSCTYSCTSKTHVHSCAHLK